jgi:hypothetical protein
MPDDPNNPLPDPDPVPPIVVPIARPERKRIECEFCECQLTPAGEVLQRGDRAKKFQRQDERIEDLERQLQLITEDRDFYKREHKAELDRQIKSAAQVRSIFDRGDR